MNDTIEHTQQSSHEKAFSKLATRLETTIDETGRYKSELDHMSAGLSAGTGIKHYEARSGIEESFQKRHGITPYQYQQAQRNENQQGQSHKQNSHTQSNGISM